MKYLIYTFSLLMVAGAYAQNKPVDKVEETKVKTIKTVEDGKVVENKVKVTTKKEQEVMTDPNYKGTIDAPRVFPKVKVTKTVSVDNDHDPFYESKDKIIYYTKDKNTFKFKAEDKGFMMADENDVMLGSAILSLNKQYYILDINNYSGIGYFNSEGNFVVEYYNSDTKTLVNEEFKNSAKF
ncbi:hypothetical protein [Psychroserpens algicola]|uniref:WG repeat-containing protein n=1 Tax=Psychroserpens algicola TaxID=1719034 RepID=A0ABT0HBW2_9FLAO|nr:hypothetical protein [Psychroserpens algicola]MCK8481859.1 hypothetical protein [Psychroserpens algicola]